jgi:hypothetical protein
MEHKVTFRFMMPRYRQIRRGSFIEQTFTKVIDTDKEAEEFGREVANLIAVFLNGYGFPDAFGN